MWHLLQPLPLWHNRGIGDMRYIGRCHFKIEQWSQNPQTELDLEILSCVHWEEMLKFYKVLLTDIILCRILDEEYFLEAKSPFKKSILIMFTIEPFLEMLWHLTICLLLQLQKKSLFSNFHKLECHNFHLIKSILSMSYVSSILNGIWILNTESQ